MRLLANNVKSKHSRTTMHMLYFFGIGFFVVFPILYLIKAHLAIYVISYGVLFFITSYIANTPTHEFISGIHYKISKDVLINNPRRKISHIGFHDIKSITKIINEKKSKL